MGIVKTCKTIYTHYVQLKNFISPPPPPKPNEANLAFMTCLLKVDVTSPGWQKAIIAVLRSNKGVRSFKMSQNGKIIVTGTADLNLLFKMLKKAESSTELIWVQSGLCSSNLFVNGLDPDGYIDDVGGPYFGANNVGRRRQGMFFPIIRGGGPYNPPPPPPYYGPMSSAAVPPPLHYGY
nr:hypothetical protein DM860_008732 [Ipomoea trifida]